MKTVLVLVVVCSIAIYSILNIAKYGKFFGKPEYDRVELVKLLSYGNFYNGKEVCTRGWYVEDELLSILKVRLDEDRYTRTAWVQKEEELITRTPGSGLRTIEMEICGKFESDRNGEFGEPPVWIAQITVSSYKTFGEDREVNGEI